MMKFLKPEEERAIIAAIQEAEGKTSGEIRVHIVRHRKGKGDVYSGAVKAFEKLGMTRTKERNGILIFIAPQDRQFSVIGDIGIHAQVTDDFWKKVRDVMQDDFYRGNFLQGILDGVHFCGEELKKYFPRQDQDQNELPDHISAG